MHDIIPDIHGQADKLEGLLRKLGWRQATAGWKNDDPSREIVFLGDFIDRGPENARVLRTVRSLVDTGKAHAIMGNHELNAIHFHTPNGDPNKPHLRERSDKNRSQHASFLREFPEGAIETMEAITWMKTLPLFFETERFRAVHACWNEAVISDLKEMTEDGVLTEEQLHRAADKRERIFRLLETTTKGPEIPLPDGYSFFDKDGNERTDVRVKWWQEHAASWADLAMSVANPDELPSTELTEQLLEQFYPSSAKPVFFGHYWLTGALAMQAHNALCLDYSAGRDGPLVAYREEDPGPLSLANIMQVL